MELGCFMAGVVLSSNGEHLVHKVNRKDKLFSQYAVLDDGMEEIKVTFNVLFF